MFGALSSRICATPCIVWRERVMHRGIIELVWGAAMGGSGAGAGAAVLGWCG